MSFYKSGFLSDEADFVAQNRADFRPYFEIAFQLNDQAHEIQHRIEVFRGDIKMLVVQCLYLRALCSFAASIRLMELGLCIDAGNTLRNLMETTIYLKKCVADPEWIVKYIKADLRHKATLISIVLEEKEMSEHHAEAREFRKKLLNEIEAEIIPKLNLADVAKSKDVGDKKMYDLFFRKLSNNNSHTSSASLAPFLKVDDDQDLEFIIYDNQAKDIPDLMIPGCWSLLECTESIIKFFKIEANLSDELEKRAVALLFPQAARNSAPFIPSEGSEATVQ
jgi:hypothetical protein